MITLQETKLKKIGQIKLPGYQIFELLREHKGGGGLLTAVGETLTPVLISTGNNDAEILTVQIKINNIDVRIVNAYGPQETGYRIQ